MNQGNTPKWKRFEKIVAKVQKDLASDASVTLDDRIQGKITNTKRQVDISIRKKIGQYEILIAIDCKDLASPVDVKDVEEVIGLIQDIEANKGVIVSASGFTKAALSRGEKAGLDLYRLVDCGDHDWKADVSIPVVCDFRSIQQFSLTFLSKGPCKLPGGDIRELDVYDKKNRYLGKIANLIKAKWNKGELPTEPGVHEGIDFMGQLTRIKFQDQFFDVRIMGNFIIEKRLYFGTLPLAEISGFKDEIKGAVVTKGFTTSRLDTIEVEKDWQRIDSLDEFTAKPFMVIRFSDYYPEQNPSNPAG
ncbi:MAG: restriction endonuclease [Candidatus Hodarchaeota archaeon]